MRRRAAAGIAAVAAAIGAGVALLVGSFTDLGEGTTTTVVRSLDLPSTGTTTAPRRRDRRSPASIPGRSTWRALPGSSPSTPTSASTGESQGSGFVVNEDGVILTNAHVITNVAESRERRQRRPGGVRRVRRPRARDGEGRRLGPVQRRRRDPCLPRRPRARPRAARRVVDVVVGEPVAAIGSPFGKQSSLTVGIVSATGRSIDSLTSGFSVANGIQVDAPINRGNSGGPLFDGDGRVIGINAQIQSTSGTAEGVGFAIPIDIARRSLEPAPAHGSCPVRLHRDSHAGRHAGDREGVRARRGAGRARRASRGRHAGRRRGPPRRTRGRRRSTGSNVTLGAT